MSHSTIYIFKNYFVTVFSVSAKISSIQTHPKCPLPDFQLNSIFQLKFLAITLLFFFPILLLLLLCLLFINGECFNILFYFFIFWGYYGLRFVPIKRPALINPFHFHLHGPKFIHLIILGSSTLHTHFWWLCSLSSYQDTKIFLI